LNFNLIENKLQSIEKQIQKKIKKLNKLNIINSFEQRI